MATALLSWSDFKTQVNAQSATIQYTESVFDYTCSLDSTFQTCCVIGKSGSATQVDFESNFKNTAIKVTSPPVNASISNNISGSQTLSKKYKFDISTTATPINPSTYITLYSYSGSGLFFGYQIVGDSTKNQMRLTIDNTVIFDFDAGMLTSFSSLLGNTQQNQMGAFFNIAGNAIDFSPRFPIQYSSLVKIEIKTSDGLGHNIKAYFVNITKET